MKIEKIGYFLSVAKHLNFTKAAQECHIAQPAISRQMSSLEEELGFALFDRSSRKVRLTPAGQSFYTSMMRFVNDYDNGVEQLRHISKERMQMLVCTGHWAFLRCFPVHWVICTYHSPRCTWSLYTGAECRQSAGFWSVRGRWSSAGESFDSFRRRFL